MTKAMGNCMRPLLMILLLGGASFQAAADPTVQRQPLPGISQSDDRSIVDIQAAPWNAIVKVQTNTGVKCTGTLIAERTVLTAAHCLFNARTGRLLPASSLHVLFGYARGEMAAHSGVISYAAGLSEDERPSAATLERDWAILRIRTAPAAAPIPLAGNALPAGQAIVAAGFNQDRAHLLMADPSCKLLAPVRADSPVLRHDCEITRGGSGGPLLIQTGRGWSVIGIAVGSRGNISLGVHASVFSGIVPHDKDS